MNFRDSDLILVKSYQGNANSFYQVYKMHGDDVTLVDIVQGGRFDFKKANLEVMVNSGTLKISSIDQIPEVTQAGHVIKKRSISPRIKKSDPSSIEMEYRYKYVKGVVDEELPAYTAKWLVPFIQAQSVKLDDKSPPSWRTLARWMKAFVEGGWQKTALRPKTGGAKGASKVHPELNKLINQVVIKHCKLKYVKYSAAYDELQLMLQELNKQRINRADSPLKCISYKGLINRFRS